MSILEDMEKSVTKVVKGVKRRGKKAAAEVEKSAENLVKRGKGLAAQAYNKLTAGATSGSTNKNIADQLKQVNAGTPYSNTPDRWKK